MRGGRPSDMDELSDSLLLLLRQVHKMVSMSYFAASRTLWIAERDHLKMLLESQASLNEEVWQLRESLRRFSSFLEGTPFIPRPIETGRASSGEIRST